MEFNSDKNKVSPLSYVSDSVVLGKDCSVQAFALIGENVKIGNNVIIYSHCYIGDNVTIGNNRRLLNGAIIYSGCIIGNNCTIGSKAVIGLASSAFMKNADNILKELPPGNVIIEDDVEIKANMSIGRPAFGSNIIQKAQS